MHKCSLEGRDAIGIELRERCLGFWEAKGAVTRFWPLPWLYFGGMELGRAMGKLNYYLLCSVDPLCILRTYLQHYFRHSEALSYLPGDDVQL